MCNRNDKVEKVSGILRAQTHSSQGITYQTRTTIVTVGKSAIPIHQTIPVPTQSSQISELALHLAPPTKPVTKQQIKDTRSSTAMRWALLIGIITFFIVVSSLSSGKSSQQTGDILCPTFFVGITAFLFFIAVPAERKANRIKGQEYQNQIRERDRIFAVQVENWNAAWDRWNKLYYCGRDDCVFLPGTNSSVPTSQMIEYLYRP